MDDKFLYKDLSELYQNWAQEAVSDIKELPAHGSDRRYFRMTGKSQRAIGVHNTDLKENIAFLTFSRHFSGKGLRVPKIYTEQLEKNIYLEQDLGDQTLFSFLTERRQQEGFSEVIQDMYIKVIDALPDFQIMASRDLDFGVCYPRSSFDRQSMMWDLNYFKYYFLKLAKISFDEQRLEDDFHKFCDFLLSAAREYFLYRDFQSRNVMIVDGEPYFIDYQGGRKGALQYDIASLLFDAKADIPGDVRERLLNRYIDRLSNYISVDRKSFMQHYYGYVLVRMMQALGAYGFRGFYERKEHFLKSVPYAVKNLEWLLHRADLPIEIPALTNSWNGLVRSSFLRQLGNVQLKLTARIQSFSYKRGIPIDEKGHGGGFVFDCRFLPNPGREDKFKTLTGKDQPVIAYLKGEKSVMVFLRNVKSIMDLAISDYQQRNFTDIMIAFGCTGGQHRSVFCAEQLTSYLAKKHNIDVEVRHREFEFK
jgi:aminoglycoside/choline kinase family phosphotransferase